MKEYTIVSHDRIICILFYEQAICRRVIKWKKVYLICIGTINKWFYHSLVWSEITSLLFKVQRLKEVDEGVSEQSCDGIQDTNKHATSLREIIQYSISTLVCISEPCGFLCSAKKMGFLLRKYFRTSPCKIVEQVIL